MGYRSRAFGTISFDPPVLAEDLKKVTFDVIGEYGWWLSEPIRNAAEDALANAVPVVGEVWEGAKVASIDFGDQDESKIYEPQDNLKNFMAALPEGTKVTGSIQVEGEEQGDVYRVLFEGRKVSIQQSVIAWSDPQEVV